MRSRRCQQAAPAATSRAASPLVDAQTRRTERARPQRESTKPNSERTARRSAPRLLSRLHFKTVFSIDLVRIVADPMPRNGVFSRRELGGQRHDHLVLIRGIEARAANRVLLFLFVGHIDAAKAEEQT